MLTQITEQNPFLRIALTGEVQNGAVVSNGSATAMASHREELAGKSAGPRHITITLTLGSNVLYLVNFNNPNPNFQ